MANHDAVRLLSLTLSRFPAVAPFLLCANDRAPSLPPDAGNRAQSPTLSLTPPHLPSASPAIDDDAILAFLPVSAFQHQAAPDSLLDAHA